jgi:hypothetical protein
MHFDARETGGEGLLRPFDQLAPDFARAPEAAFRIAGLTPVRGEEDEAANSERGAISENTPHRLWSREPNEKKNREGSSGNIAPLEGEMQPFPLETGDLRPPAGTVNHADIKTLSRAPTEYLIDVTRSGVAQGQAGHQFLFSE